MYTVNYKKRAFKSFTEEAILVDGEGFDDIRVGPVRGIDSSALFNLSSGFALSKNNLLTRTLVRSYIIVLSRRTGNPAIGPLVNDLHS